MAIGMIGAVAVIAPTPAQAATTAFTCTSDFYQVSSGNMYQYSPTTNTYTTMSASTSVSGLNAIGYNPADNLLYGLTSGTSMTAIYADGSHSSAMTLTGVSAQNRGGDFIGNNLLLTVSSGTWTLVNTSTKVVTSFTSSGTSWAPYDFAYDPATRTGYGLNGTTLYIGVVNAGGTAISVTSKSTTNTGAGASDSWGAAYVDSSGNAYFFDNSTYKLVEISATEIAKTTPAAVQITTANSLSSPNDGASCPTASSPLAPTVTASSPTSVTTTSATLHGTVTTGSVTGSNIPTGGIKICYSTSNTLVGGKLSVSPVCADATPSSLAANSSTNVSLNVTGLSPNTTYYVQIQAANAVPLDGYSDLVSFKTDAAAGYTVTFDANGGTGTMTDQAANVTTALKTNTFTRTGYTFAGWNTAEDGTGDPYADGANYPFTANTTLYAQWTLNPTVTVTFSPHGGSGSMSDQSSNSPTSLESNGYDRPGYVFVGWNTAPDGTGTSYVDGQEYNFTESVTLYAQWAAAPIRTVTFAGNGGEGTMSAQTANLTTALHSNAFTRTGYTFAGWNTAEDGTGDSYADGADYPFTSDVVLYAQWSVAADNDTGDDTGDLAYTGADPALPVGIGVLAIVLGTVAVMVASSRRHRLER
jgi:uncharacterized repeat protein (TIGR02543 family)